MKLRRFLGIVALSLFFAATAIAEAPGEPLVIGSGSGSCETWNCRIADNYSASCWIAMWPTGKVSDSCTPKCDGVPGQGGGCWCEYDGICYSI
jgi:hypothetical protein